MSMQAFATTLPDVSTHRLLGRRDECAAWRGLGMINCGRYRLFALTIPLRLVEQPLARILSRQLV